MAGKTKRVYPCQLEVRMLNCVQQAEREIKMNQLAEIIGDSLNLETGDRITTFVLPRFPKMLQAELRTHRSTSQSHYSSRAIPIEKAIKQVTEDPFILQWTRFEKGMGGADNLTETEKETFTSESLRLRDEAVETAYRLMEMGAAKQDANRFLEAWMHGGCIITATQDAWEHFFSLRTVEGVQPNFRTIAIEMLKLYRKNQPQNLQIGDWHITWMDKFVSSDWDLETQLAVSAARSARISYQNYEGNFSVEKDFALCQKLLSPKTPHYTPFEHQAKAMPPGQYKNLSGWMHQRQHIEENHSIYS